MINYKLITIPSLKGVRGMLRTELPLGVASRYDLNKGQASRLVQAETLAFNFDAAGRYAEQLVVNE